MHGSCTEVLHNSYTMDTRGLPDIYTRSPRATGPRAEGVYIRQTTLAHDITIKYLPTLPIQSFKLAPFSTKLFQ